MDEGLMDPARSETGYRYYLPDPRRCEMPEQSLWNHRPDQSRAPTRVVVARVALIVLWLAATAAFACTLYRVLSVEMPTVLQLVFLVLSTLCFAWVAAGSVSALIGFVALTFSRSIDTIALPPARVPSHSRIALLFPVYREDAAEVAALIDTTCCDLIAAGAGNSVDVFVLSDTQAPAERALEQQIYAELRARFHGRLQIFVRWRTPNEGRKAGNIRDWIERFGGGYPYFVIFDADSIMSANALLRLVAGMDENPRAGLIQTVPRLVGGRSLFAHLQQFAAGYYGPVVTAGLAAWHGHGGNYWGHNAIIRTNAFAQCAGLPRLSGAPPLGGYILSHDFVEAALMRRGGWEVHMVPSLDGTYEGCPPTLSDLIVRDRRWAQGNLQHLRLVGASGLPFLSRMHLAMGAISYIASPLWALSLLVGVMLAVQAKSAVPSYFGNQESLFPNWPVFDAETALGLFFATLFVVHLPKLLGGIWALRNAEERRRNGGGLRVGLGVLLESILSTLIAPKLMVTQSSAVLNILIGRDAGWGAQRRHLGANATFLQMVGQYRWPIMWGIAGAAVCATISPAVLAWMSPIIAGLLLAAPLSFLTAQNSPPWIATLLGTGENRHPSALLNEAETHRTRLKNTNSCEMAAHENSKVV